MSITTTAARIFTRAARAAAAATEVLAAAETPVVTEVPAPVTTATAADPFAVFADTTAARLDSLLGWDDEADLAGIIPATPEQIGAILDAEDGITAPVTEVVKPAPAREFLSVDQLPAVDVIEAEALAFDKAADKYRAGDRGKNRARKLLDKVPAGRYGRAIVEWVPSNTDRADLDAIEAIFKAHNLGPVPMKRDRDSLKVTILPA